MQVTATSDNTDVYSMLEEEMQDVFNQEQESAPTDINDPRLDKLKERAAELAELSDNKKSLTFTKILMLCGIGISLLMCIACIVLRVVYCTDITDIMSITLASLGMDSAYGGFYMWKEKNANRAKYAQQFVLLFADAYGVDSAIRIAEVVLKD